MVRVFESGYVALFQGRDVFEPLDETKRHMYQSFPSRRKLRDVSLNCVQCVFWFLSVVCKIYIHGASQDW